MLKSAYKRLWVPIMGRLLSKLIPLIEGSKPIDNPSYDIDGNQKLENNN
tara:strand:- start:32 stop:178 length:147 start_codon:yes stop_codon:yes gene_type:complete